MKQHTTYTEAEALNATDRLAPKAHDGWDLVVLVPDGRSEHRFRAPAEIIVGRDAECEICIDHASVSRRHARIRFYEDATIEELGSANGTRIGSTRLVPGHAVQVRPGTLIEVGDALLFLRPPAEKPTEVSSHSVSVEMARALELAHVATKTSVGVLLAGPKGAGKAHLAARIHAESPRATHPFLKLRVTSKTTARELLGASEQEPGLIERAMNGVLLLQGIEDASAAVHSVLDRVLSGGVIEREDTTRIALGARILCTARCTLDALRERMDSSLLARLSLIYIWIPPLSARRGEIRQLAEDILRDAPRPGLGLSDAALGLLSVHTWTGNVDELRAVLHEASNKARTSAIAALDLGHLQEQAEELAEHSASETEKRKIRVALKLCAGNQTKAAKMLGISRRTMVSRLRELELPRPRKS
jgi:two-component system, NtrC family, response regulator AtoC